MGGSPHYQRPTAMRSGDMSFAEPDLGHLCTYSADGREAHAAYFDQRHPIFNGR